MALLTRVLIVAFICMSAACSPIVAPSSVSEPYPPATEPVIGDIQHLPTGTLLSFEQMVAGIRGDRLIYIGETHDNPASHRLQFETIQALHANSKRNLAIGMEMFNPRQQAVLDAWSQGELSEKEFIQQTNWYETWRIDYAYYRELLNLIRDLKLPVVALNISKQDKMAAMSGNTPLPTNIDPYYRETLLAYFEGHNHGSANADSFIQIQSLWDDTMAQSIVTFLQHPDHLNDQMIVIAGDNHIRHGYGIPRRVFQQLPFGYTLIGNKDLEVDDSKKDQHMDVSLPELPLPAYHYLVYTRYEAGPHRQQLGIMLEATDGAVTIKEVISGSVAERFNLQAGDRITAIDDTTVSTPFDVIYAVRQCQVGDSLKLSFLRDGDPLKIAIQF
ncbi:MAG: ChaN family lipoprotein [Deltaproteobacteria bacterium]|nr:ChaN family lipoprotein [Deltaproteobacteria bacterium]